MTGHAFPAPIGGTPLPNVDFAPSLMFAILYALLVPLMAYRITHRRSRTILLLGTIGFAIERIVIFCLRALQSRRESSRVSEGLVTYMQVSFALGFLSRGNDMVNLLRCVLVNSSYGSDTYGQSPAAQTKVEGDRTFCIPSHDTSDQPRFRFWARRSCDVLGLLFIIPLVPGIIANGKYKEVIDSVDQAQKTKELRLISVIIALVLFVILIFSIVWAKRKQPRVTKRSTSLLVIFCLPMIIISIYRLCVMGETVTSLDGSSKLNTPSAKALFYVFHVLPEFIFTALVLCVNIREAFGTGPWGDWKGNDETTAMKKKREEKEREKAENRAANRANWQELKTIMPSNRDPSSV